MILGTTNNPNSLYMDYKSYNPAFCKQNVSKPDSTAQTITNSKTSNSKKAAIAASAIALSAIGILALVKGKHIKNIIAKPKTKPNLSDLPKKNVQINSEPVSEIKTAVAEKGAVEKPQEPEIVKPIVKESAEIKKISGTDIDAIQSEEEYLDVLEKLKKSKTWREEWNVEGVNPYEAGLMPYIGEADISDYLNGYLRENTMKPFWKRFGYTQEVINDYIRVVDYAIKKTGEAQGSYKGVVYRYGWFDAKPKAFTSTASSPYGAVCHAGKTRPYNKRYNIILTNHGTGVQKIQERIGNKEFAENEEEVILSIGHEFEEIKTMTPELENLKQKLFETMRERNGYLREDMVDLHFWREI